jgi:hypothetical protein
MLVTQYLAEITGKTGITTRSVEKWAGEEDAGKQQTA